MSPLPINQLSLLQQSWKYTLQHRNVLLWIHLLCQRPLVLSRRLQLSLRCASQSGSVPRSCCPSLAKSKAQSFQLGMSRPAPESKAPPFRFGTGAKTSLSTSTSLEDMFGDSPPHERPLSRNNSSTSLAPPRLRPSFNHARSSGSPAPIHSQAVSPLDAPPQAVSEVIEYV